MNYTLFPVRLPGWPGRGAPPGSMRRVAAGLRPAGQAAHAADLPSPYVCRNLRSYSGVPTQPAKPSHPAHFEPHKQQPVRRVLCPHAIPSCRLGAPTPLKALPIFGLRKGYVCGGWLPGAPLPVQTRRWFGSWPLGDTQTTLCRAGRAHPDAAGGVSPRWLPVATRPSDVTAAGASAPGGCLVQPTAASVPPGKRRGCNATASSYCRVPGRGGPRVSLREGVVPWWPLPYGRGSAAKMLKRGCKHPPYGLAVAARQREC